MNRFTYAILAIGLGTACTGDGKTAAIDGGAEAAAGTGGARGTGGAAADAPGMGGVRGTGGAPAVGGASGTGGTSSPGTSACTAPVFVTADHNGGWSDGGYYVHNNMWNSAYTLGPETLYACSYHDWYVVSNQTNDAGAVKTYPNVHKDFADVPLSSFRTLTSSFAATSPHVGIYNVAYDIWINGVATTGCTEIMIWTENFKQVPAGTRATTATLGGHSYDVWKTSDNSYIAFVPNAPFTSGVLDLLEIFKWTIGQGWLAANATLGQICFGVEIVATGGGNVTFYFTDFAIKSS